MNKRRLLIDALSALAVAVLLTIGAVVATLHLAFLALAGRLETDEVRQLWRRLRLSLPLVMLRLGSRAVVAAIPRK